MYFESELSAGRSSSPSPRWKRFFAALLGALGLALMLPGCSSGSGTASRSLIRSINAYVPASGTDGSLTLLGNGIFLTGGSLGFGQIGNGGSYINLVSGSFSASASGPTGTTPLLLTGQTLSGNNTAYMLAAAGEAGQTGTLAPQLLLIPNFTTNLLSIPAGDAAIRVINLSLNSNPIGLYATASGAPTSALNTGLASVAYGYNSSSNAYVAVPTTQLTAMALVDAGSTHTALSLASTNTLNSTTFAAGQAYTLYIFGQPGNSAQPLGALWVTDYPSS